MFHFFLLVGIQFSNTCLYAQRPSDEQLANRIEKLKLRMQKISHSPEIKNILNKWNLMAKEVETSNITIYRFLFHNADLDTPSPSKQVIYDLIKERLIPLVKLKFTHDDLVIATADLLDSRDSKRAAWEGNWAEYEIMHDTKSGFIRNNSTFFDQKGEPEQDFYVRKNGEEIHYKAYKNQVTVAKYKSIVSYFTLNDLRTIPLYGLLRTQDLELAELESGRSILKSNQFVIEYETSNGFVHKLSEYFSNGSLKREYLQFLPQLTDSGVVVPKLNAYLTYDKDSNVSYCFIFVSEDLEINRPLPADAFEISIPKDTLVANLSEKAVRTGQEITQHAVSDVSQYAKTIKNLEYPESPRPIEQSKNRTIAWLIVFNAFVILLLVVFILRKKMHTK